MSENTKITLNLAWLKSPKKESQSELDTWTLAQENWKSKPQYNWVHLEFQKDIHPPMKMDTYPWVEQNSDAQELSEESSLKDIQEWALEDKKDTHLEEIQDSPPEDTGDDISSMQTGLAQEEKQKGEKMSFASIAWKKEVLQDTKTTQQDKESDIQKSEIKKDTQELGWDTWNLKTSQKPKEDVKFANYKSKFEDESENIINKIRRFRYTPKTRTGFLASLIILTWLGIWLMMIFFPEKHSLSIYKASLLDIYAWDQNARQEEMYDHLLSHHNHQQEDTTDAWEDMQDTEDKEAHLLDEDTSKRDIENWDTQDIDTLEESMYRVRSFLYDRYR